MWSVLLEFKWIAVSTWPYQWFVHGFSTIAIPLTALLRGSRKKLTWNSAAEEAFTCLQKSFTMALVLKHPDPSQQFTVEVDTDVVVGEILSQLLETDPNFFQSTTSPGNSPLLNAIMTWGIGNYTSLLPRLQEHQGWCPLMPLPFHHMWTQLRNHLAPHVLYPCTHLGDWPVNWGFSALSHSRRIPNRSCLCVYSVMGPANHLGKHDPRHGPPMVAAHIWAHPCEVLVAQHESWDCQTHGPLVPWPKLYALFK